MFIDSYLKPIICYFAFTIAGCKSYEFIMTKVIESFTIIFL